MGEVAVNGQDGQMMAASAEEDVLQLEGMEGEASKENQGESSLVNGVLLTNDRIKRRAKRPSKFHLGKEIIKDTTGVVAPIRALKNSRKSRNGFGRGLPKKGGAGGKGTWGVLGTEIVEEELDAKDPNYDESEKLDDVKLKVIKMDDIEDKENLQKKISSLVAEYFDHGDTHETFISLEELGLTLCAHLVVVTTVELALDHKPSHREMTSVLLADLYGHLLFEHHFTKGYDMLIKNASDLKLDTPDAPTFLGNFIARSIADDCIPPKFLQSYKGKVENEDTIKVLSRAESLLSMRHGMVRLDNVWGVGGGTRPVKYLVRQMGLLLEEYLSSSDKEEASRCLMELEVPHFHHELVYEAIVMVLEKMDDRTSKMMCDLLATLFRAVIITPHQMKEGFFRIYEDMPQICLDVPPAYLLLEKFVLRCQENKMLCNEVIKKLPTRGRKRFVSEGDGGRVKDDAYF